MTTNPSHKNDGLPAGGKGGADNLALLKTTIDSSLDMIQVFRAVRNAGGAIIDFVWVLNNEAAARIHGEVIGKSLLQLQPGVMEEGIFDAFVQVVQSGLPRHYERHYVHEQFNGWFYQSVVKLDDGVATTTADITERKKAEQEILRLKDEMARKANGKYQTLFNSIDEGFHIIELVYDERGNPIDYLFLEVNHSFERLTGLKDAAGKYGSEISPGTEDVWFQAYDNVVQTGEAIRFEDYNAFTGRWYSAYAFPADAAHRHQVAVLFNDSTERKQWERELTRFNEFLQATFDSSLQIIQLFKAIRDEQTGAIVDFEWVMTNKRWNDLHGPMAGKRLLTQNPAVVETGLFDEFKKVTESGVSIIQEHCYPHEQFDGWFLQTVAKVEDGFLLSTLDITERKQREQQQEYLMKLNDMLRAIADAIEVEEKVTALAMEYFRADRCYYAVIEDGDAVIIRDARKGGLPSVAGRYRIINFAIFSKVIDGGVPLVVDNAAITDLLDEPLRELCLQLGVISFVDVPVIKKGKAVGLLCIVQSAPREWTEGEVQLAAETAERTWAAIEWAKAETALFKSEEKYRWLFETMDLGFVLCEPLYDASGNMVDSRYVEINPAFRLLTGIDDDVTGKRILEVMPGLDPAWFGYYQSVMETKEPVHFERFVPQLDRWYNVSSFYYGGGLYAVYYEDVTKRKKAEETLHRAQESYRVQLEQEVRDRTIELLASRDELEREQHFLEQVTDKAPLLIYVYDLREERFTYINKRVEALIGKTEEYIYAMGPHLFQAILHPDDL